MEMDIELGAQVIRSYETAMTDRKNWDAHWDEVAKYVVPRKDNIYGQATPGEKRANRLFDSEGIRSNDELAAALHGMLTNPSLIWFNLSTGDNELDRNKNVSAWLFDTTNKMIRALNNSNFQTEILETYTDLGSIGTTVLRIEEDEDEIVRFHSSPIYPTAVEEDSRGRIDTVIRKFEYNLRQIYMEYGKEIFDEDERRGMSQDPNFKFEVIHEVSPRSKEERKGKVGKEAMPFKSIHVLVQTQKVLRESGFEEFPYAIPRWTKTNEEKYGRSPAMKALADIKMMNATKKTYIQASQLASAPPLQIPDNAFLAPLNLKPFGRNYKRSGMKDKVEPLFTGGAIQISIELMDRIKETIRNAFFIDKLNLVENDRMTATEVMQRRDEQLRLLGPILGRLSRELLKPIIDRVYGIMDRKNMFKDLPAEIEDPNLDIKYVSSIAQAQLTAQSENIVRAIQATGVVLEFQPEVMDNIDGDALLKHNIDIYNVDPSIIRKDKEVEGMREQRAQAQQAQEGQEQMGAEADVINKVGQVDQE